MNTENNKIIADFLGLKTISERDFLDYNYDTNDLGILHILESKKYDTDWNQLMEVVEKIDGIKKGMFIEGNLPNQEDWEGNNFLSTNIKETYNACVEFIKWHNEQK